jgi:cardiolipin synthase
MDFDFKQYSIYTYTAYLVIVYVIAIACSVFALWRSRTPQGTAAWIVSLLTIPVFAIPLFMLIGRNKFYGYVRKRQNKDRKADKELNEAKKVLESIKTEVEADFQPLNKIAQSCQIPMYSSGNEFEILINGEATYKSLFDAIKNAKKYILFQFYIFRDDQAGKKFAEALKQKAKEGVKVYFLYDNVGTSLPRSFIKELKAAGIKVAIFRGMKRWHSRMQVNFRNHRKIVVADGEIMFTGGLNIGNDYLGLYPNVGPWRDTHIKVKGPAALTAQLSFVKDWHWATDEIIDVDWKLVQYPQNANCLMLATSPSDPIDACLLAHLHTISTAKKRIHILNPYFIPPESYMNQLRLAILRGVEVKIVIPKKNDSRLVQWASEVAQEAMIAAGAEVYCYTEGFLHQKVTLIDDTVFQIGSINADSRSFFINFEATVIGHDKATIKQVDEMIQKDLSQSRKLSLAHFTERSFWVRARSRAANLVSPML